MTVGAAMGKKGFDKAWITQAAEAVLRTYSEPITIRQLHYRLVAQGMTNDVNHYKRVISAMTDARWNGSVRFGAFVDRERSMSGETEAAPVSLKDEVERAQYQIQAWMENYHLNRWENQRAYVEVWIEKKALQGVFEGPCEKLRVALAPCKGYPSLTFLHEAKQRFSDAEDRGQDSVILYFGDYDPSGEDIPRSVKENLLRMGIEVEVERVALTAEQIEEMGLPSVPAKEGDSRSRTWSGDGAVELDAIEPAQLAEMVTGAIVERFDPELFRKLRVREKRELHAYQKVLREFVRGLYDRV